MYCDLPSNGSTFVHGQTFCTLESVKAVGDVYSPLDGEVIEINESLSSQPNLVNQEPESDGWLVKMKYTGSFPELSKKWKDAVAYKESLQ